VNSVATTYFISDKRTPTEFALYRFCIEYDVHVAENVRSLGPFLGPSAKHNIVEQGVIVQLLFN
jgi:hypothetical protein